MASSLAETGLDQNAQPNRRRQITQACDKCRERKVRCDAGFVPGATAASSSITQPTSSGDAFQSLVCRRCSLLHLPCTFLLPVKARGPMKGAIRRARECARGERTLSPKACLLPPSTNGLDLSLESPPHSNFSDGRTYSHSHDGTQSHDATIDIQTTSPSSISTDNHSNIPNAANLALSHSSLAPSHPTDKICDRSLFVTILEDYLELMYPSMPIVHIPSFHRDLSQGRDLSDDDFLGLTIAMCAVLVATMPRKFQEYQSGPAPLRFETRTDMVHCCREMTTGLQDLNHYDIISLKKWAIPYLLSIAYFQIGQHNRARMLEVEAIQLARLLDLQNPQSHIGLSCIETQLRKKAFWLMFFTFVHLKLMRKERLAFIDETTLETSILHQLLPEEVDDEMILVDCILPQIPGNVSLATAFNHHALTFWAAIMPTSLWNREGNTSSISMLSVGSASRIDFLTQRLEELRYVLDGVAPDLRPWKPINTTSFNPMQDLEQTSTKLKAAQLETLRADIHVTHLWLQSIIVEEVAALKKSLSTTPDPKLNKSLWNERQDICHRMLHVLHGISISRLEPNGNHLTHKIRDVAVTLLGSPFELSDPITKRANQYLQEFIDILARLDASDTMSTVNMKMWIVVES